MMKLALSPLYNALFAGSSELHEVEISPERV